MILMAVNLVAVKWFGELESFLNHQDFGDCFYFIGYRFERLIFSYPVYRNQSKFWTAQ